MQQEIKRYLLAKKVLNSGIKTLVEKILHPQSSDLAKKIATEQLKEALRNAKEPTYNPDRFWGNKVDVAFQKLLNNPNSLAEFGLTLQKEEVPLLFYILFTEGVSVGGDALAYGIGGFRDPSEAEYSSKFVSYFDFFEDLFIAFANGELKGKRVQVFLEERETSWKAFLKELPELIKRAEEEIHFLEKINKELKLGEKHA